jgi:hypothetical protein
MKSMTKRKLVVEEGGVLVMTKPDHVVLKPLELVCGRDLEEFGDTDQKSSKILKAVLNRQFWRDFGGPVCQYKCGQ